MEVHMKTGIIGAGEIGGTLTRRFTALGHDVSVANSRGPETLRELVRETGATDVSAYDAARAGELAVVTIPGSQTCRRICSQMFQAKWLSDTPARIIHRGMGGWQPLKTM